MSRFVRGVTLLGLYVVAVTETLSLAHAIDRVSITVAWLVFIACAVIIIRRLPAKRHASLRPQGSAEWVAITGMAFVAVVNVLLAIGTAPNAWDAMTYHLPRISHWIENGSVAHYPTHIDRQLWITPGHEYFALHLELLSGTHRLVNLVQWLASLGCAAIAAGITKQLGGGRKAALFAALFTMTLPMAIAQASGSQVDLFAAFWAGVAIYLMLDSTEPGALDAAVTGGAVGLAVLAKTTAVIVLGPYAVWIGVALLRRSLARGILTVTIAVVVLVAVNAGHLLRNQRTFGNPLFNPRGATVVNERFGLAVTTSNVLRNATIHTSTRWEGLNARQQSLVESWHRAIRIAPSDSATTFLGGQYRVVRRQRTEAFAGAGLHILLGIVLIVLARHGGESGRRRNIPYGLLLCSGIVLFCVLLKWQPWHGRLHLSFLVLFAPLVGIAAERARSRSAYLAAAVIVIVAGMPMLLRNAARPLAHSQPVFLVPRERQYFNQLYWMYEPTVKAAQFLARRRCSRVGLMTTWGDPEETLREVMRNRARGRVQIIHLGIPPDRYPPGPAAPAERVCAIVSQNAFPGSAGSPLPVPSGFGLALDAGMVRVYLPASTVPR